jgi:tripartite-type tricarboxylate transporter receptor subunit TctC
VSSFISRVMTVCSSGKLKPLAVTTPQRSSVLPNEPTMKEAGLKGY